MKKILSGLSFLLLPFLVHSPSHSTSFKLNKEVNDRFVPEVSLCLDNHYLKYEKHFLNEKNFWINAFTLDSSKALVYKRKTMEIMAIINVPEKGKFDAVADSIYEANNENREDKTIGVIYGRRQKMKRAVERAFNHLDYIVDSLEAHELPTSLAAIPFFESEFRNDAGSKAGAVGMWQFRSATARGFGLKVNRYVDERKDPKKSLSAFMKYMEKANDRFESDLLALVSYNTGLYSKYFRGRDTISDIEIVKRMGFAPRHYAASFFASREILKDPLKYYGNLDLKKDSVVKRKP